MARGRMVNTSIATDKRLNGLSVMAELLYLKTIPHLDRDGLILGDPLVLWGKVCPRRPELMAEIADIIKEWVESDLVIAYECDEGSVLFFTGFAKNQTGMRYDREAVSTLPEPPGYERTLSGLAPAKVRSSDGPNPPEDQYKYKDNGNGGDGAPPAAVPASSDPLFVRLQEEWMVVNRAQLDSHTELAQRYGFDNWLRGFNACKRAARSNMGYVEKVIISHMPDIAPPKKAAPQERYCFTDPVTGEQKEVMA